MLLTNVWKLILCIFFSLNFSHDFIGEFTTSYRELSRGQSQFNVYEVRGVLLLFSSEMSKIMPLKYILLQRTIAKGWLSTSVCKNVKS